MKRIRYEKSNNFFPTFLLLFFFGTVLRHQFLDSQSINQSKKKKRKNTHAVATAITKCEEQLAKGCSQKQQQPV